MHILISMGWQLCWAVQSQGGIPLARSNAQPGLLGWIHPTISRDEEGRASLPWLSLLGLAACTPSSLVSALLISMRSLSCSRAQAPLGYCNTTHVHCCESVEFPLRALKA